MEPKPTSKTQFCSICTSEYSDYWQVNAFVANQSLARDLGGASDTVLQVAVRQKNLRPQTACQEREEVEGALQAEYRQCLFLKPSLHLALLYEKSL